MKKSIYLMMVLIFMFTINACRLVNRAYNNEDLENIAIEEHGFSEYIVFKIVDAETATYLTGKAYYNSGVVIGIRNELYTMLFVPKRLDEDSFIVLPSFRFNLNDIYQKLHQLEDEDGNRLYLDPSGDYGGLSLSTKPYQSLKQRYPHFDFDVELIFTFTTDQHVFYATYIEGEVVVFAESGNILIE